MRELFNTSCQINTVYSGMHDAITYSSAKFKILDGATIGSIGLEWNWCRCDYGAQSSL